MGETIILGVSIASVLIAILSVIYLAKNQQATSTRFIVKQALVASLYIAITWVFRSVSFDAIQFRISEALLVLVLFNPRYISGLTIGTFIANFILSDLGWIDWTAGTIASMIAMGLMVLLKNKVWLALTMPALINGLIIGWELTYLFQTPFMINALSVAAGELGVLFTFGLALYTSIKSNKKFRQLISQ